MRTGSLTRLRLAFALVGLVLLAPLGLLLWSAEQRFSQERRLRHQVVAERIFDEMEAELTALLEQEAARPSTAYQATDTRIASWSPYVVGYFRRDSSGLELPAEAQLSGERKARIERAVSALLSGAEAAREAKWASAQLERMARDAQLHEQAMPISEANAEQNSAAVLQKLNRAATRRYPQSVKSKPSAEPDNRNDPLMGL